MSAEEALLHLLRLLKDRDYRFTTVTPATHARVLARPCERVGLRDIFGWNRWFSADDLDSEFLACLQQSGTLEQDGECLHSKVRVASISGDLFLHSGFPTTDPDAIFLGPDTYRFVRFIRESLGKDAHEPNWIVDMGAGSGAGAITAARVVRSARITAIDVNGKALELAAVNAKAAEVTMETLHGSNIPAGPDLVIANPPYMMDSRKRAYRDGGNLFGGSVALDWAKQALRSLAARGKMLLYTGASIIEGESPLAEALAEACTCAGARLSIEEIDPDVFSEELDQEPYTRVERIAVIAATIEKR